MIVKLEKICEGSYNPPVDIENDGKFVCQDCWEHDAEKDCVPLHKSGTALVEIPNSILFLLACIFAVSVAIAVVLCYKVIGVDLKVSWFLFEYIQQWMEHRHQLHPVIV